MRIIICGIFKVWKSKNFFSSGIEDRQLWNPAVVKQALIESSIRLSNSASMFEQGSGRMDLLAAFNFMRKYEPMITLAIYFLLILDLFT